MTRGAMKAQIAQMCNLKLEPGSMLGDPDAIDGAINRSADVFAGPGMDCYWSSETAALVQNQAEYGAPLFYKVKGAYWLDGSGNWYPLMPTTPQKLDLAWPNWRNETGQTTLRYIAFEGVNRFSLYPYYSGTPTSAQTAGGIKFEGFCQTNASGVSTWPADITECPLPSWSHAAIAMGAVLDVAGMMLASDLESERRKAPAIIAVRKPDYVDLKGKAESAAASLYDQQVRATLSPAWVGWAYAA